MILVGATIVITEGIKNINDFFSAFNYPATKFATFLVPASIRILLQFSSNKLSELADRIDFIETGADAISTEDMKRLCEILPDSRLYNTYASTETGIVSTYNFNDGKCVASCIGVPMKHSKVIIDDANHIICKGNTIMSGYIGDEEQTSIVLKNNAIYTSDMGRIDEDGMLHLMGREGDVINVGGYKISPTEVEDVAMSYPYVQDCICIAVSHKITGLALKLLVVTSNENLFNTRELALFLKSKLEQYKVPLIYETVPQIKRTFNGKLNRKYYAH